MTRSSCSGSRPQEMISRAWRCVSPEARGAWPRGLSVSVRPRAAFVDLHPRLEALGTDHLPPGLDPPLERHDPRLGKRDLDSLQDLLFGETEVQGYPNVALDVPL